MQAGDIVVFIHGWTPVVELGNQAAWDTSYATIKAFYESKGVRFYAPLMTSNDIPSCGVSVAAYIQKLLAVEPIGTKVCLQGHSQGGLIARWCIKKAGGAGNVREYVSYDTPEYGQWLSALLNPQMAPTSLVINQLNTGDDTPDVVGHYLQVMNLDGPQNVLEGAQVMLFNVNHRQIVNDLTVLTAVWGGLV